MVKKKNCFIWIYMEIYDIYKDIPEEVDTSFDASICELNRPLSKGKNKQVVGLRDYQEKSRENMLD